MEVGRTAARLEFSARGRRPASVFHLYTPAVPRTTNSGILARSRSSTAANRTQSVPTDKHSRLAGELGDAVGWPRSVLSKPIDDGLSFGVAHRPIGGALSFAGLQHRQNRQARVEGGFAAGAAVERCVNLRTPHGDESGDVAEMVEHRRHDVRDLLE
jgi:hypothetical protein